MRSGTFSQPGEDGGFEEVPAPGSRGDKLPATRRSRILDYVATNGEASVVELAERFRVSPDTVRRDLERLDEAGALIRTHGGAHRAQPAATLDSVATRGSSHQHAKRAIARIAADLVSDGDTLLLNGGTTTLEVARALGERQRLTVVTPSPGVAQAVPPPAAHTIHILGGRWYPEFEVVIGPVALPGTKSLNADTLVLGAAGISTRGVSIPNLEEAEMLQDMIQAAARVILVVDSSKFGRDAVAMIATFADIDILVTETAPDAELLRVLLQHDVQVVTDGEPQAGPGL